jgi:hypothetical protein
MTEPEVVALMESSRSSAEWNANADTVKSRCRGYPDFWYSAIISSGLCGRVSARWGGSDQIQVTPIRNINDFLK